MLSATFCGCKLHVFGHQLIYLHSRILYSTPPSNSEISRLPSLEREGTTMSLPIPAAGSLHICRSCRRALFLASSSSLASSRQLQPSSSSQPRRRPFSQTSAFRAKTLPHFPETTSSELNDLLSTVRTTHLLASLLAKPHRNLVYKPKNHTLLRNDPGVNITLADGERIRLQPITDLPPFPVRKTELRRYLDILTKSSTTNTSSDSDDSSEPIQSSVVEPDTEDTSPPDPTTSLSPSSTPSAPQDPWSTLLPLLSGFADTTVPVSATFRENVTRKAGETHNLHRILEVAESVKLTGFTLADENVTREIMLQCHSLVQQGVTNGDKKMVEKGWRYARHVVMDMMEMRGHCARQGLSKFGKGQRDLRGDLWIVGALFEACVAKVVVVDGGKDEAGLVQQMVKRVLGVVRNTAVMAQAPGEEENKLWVERRLERRVPLWNGLRMALNTKGLVIDGGEGERKGLERLLVKLDGEVQDLRPLVKERADGKSRRSLMMLEAVEQGQTLST